VTEQITTIKPVKQDLSFEENREHQTWLRNYLESKDTLVLATSQNNIPYCNLMCFTLTEEGLSLILITPTNTLKYENMSKNAAVSILITDDHGPVHPEQGTAVTLSGSAAEVFGQSRKKSEDLFIAKYPELNDFARSSETAVFHVVCQKAIIVRRFQHLTEIFF
jgi:nitroimidazol reductase NimA-like FMN-containing flavoprotein (pyridoxamine 5'-phosphate oxidase superfamily)